jgi:phospholipid-binding lipoprotein MlaA
MTIWRHRLFVLITACLISQLFPTVTCAETLTLTDSVPATNANDPYESFNRVMFHFNDFVDKAALKPAATIYNKILPKPLSKGLNNIFSNIDNITTTINDVLQFNFYQASSDAWRVLINSTVGILGFFDVAQYMGLDQNSEDLGLTFAQWGWTSSDYLVLPFIGPSTVRDGIAWPINYEFLTLYPYINPVGERYAIYGTSILSKRAKLLRFGDVMQQAALDRYVFMRDAYLQNRAYRIERNKQLDDPYLNKNSLLQTTTSS